MAVHVVLQMKAAENCPVEYVSPNIEQFVIHRELTTEDFVCLHSISGDRKESRRDRRFQQIQRDLLEQEYGF